MQERKQKLIIRNKYAHYVHWRTITSNAWYYNNIIVRIKRSINTNWIQSNHSVRVSDSVWLSFISFSLCLVAAFRTFYYTSKYILVTFPSGLFGLFKIIIFVLLLNLLASSCESSFQSSLERTLPCLHYGNKITA